MLQFATDGTNNLIYLGKVVGTYDVKDGSCRVQLDIEFATRRTEDWVNVLGALVEALRKIQPPAPKADYVFETSAEDVEFVGGFQTLDEKYVSAGGDNWNFHKTDVDPWPSKLHGHSGRQKLDAITGQIYDVNTRQQVGQLAKKPLARLQSALRGNKDFPHANTLLPPLTRAGKIIEALEDKND
jgi:hypothetical protein